MQRDAGNGTDARHTPRTLPVYPWRGAGSARTLETLPAQVVANQPQQPPATLRVLLGELERELSGSRDLPDTSGIRQTAHDVVDRLDFERPRLST